MYTEYFYKGVICRDSDGVTVSPVDDANNPDFLEYNAWANDGNTPALDLSGAELLVQVPQSVSPIQMRRALNQLGLRDSVEAAVAASDISVKDAWDFATEFRRDNTLVISFGEMLGADLDSLFIFANSL